MSWSLPSTDSGRRLAKIFLIVGCRPACSTSSQWAPSKTGVAMSVAGGVTVRVFSSVPRDRLGQPTPLDVVPGIEPQRAA